MSNLSVIILSAGKGTRMKSNISKPLHKIGNLEMINHVVNTAKKLDTQEIVIVASEENFEELKKNVSEKIKINIQYNRNGTGGAAKIGLEKIEHKNNNILIMYGDVPLIKTESYQNMLRILDEQNAAMVVMGFEVADINKKYGRLIVKNNFELEKIVEYKDATNKERQIKFCNAGIIAVKGEYLENLLSQTNDNNASGEYYLTDIIEIARKQNLPCNYMAAEEKEVMGINSREELAEAEKIFQDSMRKKFMLDGITLIDPQSTYFSYDTEISNDTIIEPNVVFLPGIKIESNVVIKSFSYLEGCTIKSNSSIGPFARIRPETTINENSKIGNFVEIKKSNIEKNVKIGHLTYIGNTEIGENTNIGAGTITCNYDGFNKFKTKIGKDSFVGSNTIFVAPVEIGENSLTAAGSVITKNVGKDDLAITRCEQKNLKGASAKFKERKKLAKK